MTTPYFNAKDVCINCQESVKNTRYFVCLKCDENYLICKPCFAAGAEMGTHVSDHPYKVMDEETYPIFLPAQGTSREAEPGPSQQAHWSASEELRLIRAMDQYQFGNWVDVAGHVGTRSSKDCEEHYVHCYLNGNLGEKTWAWAAKDPGNQRLGITDHTVSSSGSLGLEENDLTALPEPKITDAQAEQLGFLKKRQDFEIEFDNGAERLICTMDFPANDDSDTEYAKLLKIDRYYRVLCERDTRKRVALEYHLLEAFFGVKTEKKSLTSSKGVTQQRKWKLRESELTRKSKWMARFFRMSMLEATQALVLQEEIFRDYVEQTLRPDCEKLMAEFNGEVENKQAGRKRAQSFSEVAGPSGVPRARANKYPASASKVEKTLPGTPVQRRGERICPGRRPSTRNIAAALDAEPEDEDGDEARSDVDEGLDSASSYDDSASSNGSSPSKPRVKRRKMTRVIARKTTCNVKRRRICQAHPASPGLLTNA